MSVMPPVYQHLLNCQQYLDFVAVGTSGNVAIVPSPIDRAVLSQNCNKVALDQTLALPKWVVVTMQTESVLLQLREKTTDTARQFLSLTNLKQVVIPLPHVAEQEQIVAEVERRLSVVDDLEATVAATLKRVERLRQAILERASSGRLVAQDTADEPAGVLLARIQAGRASIRRNGHRRQNGSATSKESEESSSEPIRAQQQGLWSEEEDA